MESPSVVADKESFSAADTAMLERLHAKKAEWVSLSFKEKEALLERMLTRFRAINLRQWCDDAVTVQGYDTASYVGEVTSAIEGIANVGAITNRLTGLIRTYRSLAKSGVPPPLKSTSRPDGRLVARVFPFDADDKKGQTGGAGVTAEVWSAEGGELQRLPGTQPGLCLVLGAGNQSFLSLCDALYWLFVEGMVVVLKHHPIRGFNKVIFDSVCEELLERGYFASTLDLGLPHASWLTSHVLVDQVHMTGGVRTHDAIVWGASPAEQAANKAAGTPVLTKPMSSELGCVTPWAICPGGGEWSTAQIEHHAGVLTLPFISQSSCNCCAPKVVVLDRDWPYAKQVRRSRHCRCWSLALHASLPLSCRHDSSPGPT